MLPYSEAGERNKGPILEQLLRLLPARGHLLEIGSGTGQHVVHFAPAYPRLELAADRAPGTPRGLECAHPAGGQRNILPAIELDVAGAWPDRHFVAAYSANTAHIMPWPAVCAMFAGIGGAAGAGWAVLPVRPVQRGRRFTAASNAGIRPAVAGARPGHGLA